MRKWIALPVILTLVVGGLYLFIPSKMVIDERAALPVNAKAFARSFLDEKSWLSWWPGEKPSGTGYPLRFSYKAKTYTLLQKRFSSYLISVAEGGDSLLTELVMIPLQNGTAQVAWLGTAATASAPVARAKGYFRMKGLAADFQTLLGDLKSFYANEDKLYGFHIQEGSVTDSLLVSTVAQAKGPASTEAIYSLVDKLQAFIQKNDAKQTGPPMLNVFKNTDSGYTTRVALPVNKRLPNEGDIQFKWMLGNGNILLTEVKGGPAQIQKAFAQMQNYIDDNRANGTGYRVSIIGNGQTGRTGYKQVDNESVLAGDVNLTPTLSGKAGEGVLAPAVYRNQPFFNYGLFWTGDSPTIMHRFVAPVCGFSIMQRRSTITTNTTNFLYSQSTTK